jgi:hypothetical protein
MRQQYMWLDPAKPAVGVWGEGSTPFYQPPHRSSQMTVSRQYDLSELPEAHAVAFTPIVTRVPGSTPDGAIAHRMTLLLCTDAVKRYPTVTRSLPSLDVGAPCQEMIYAYDRDAGPVVLPENVGFRLGGKGAHFSVLVLEVHYLLPGLDVSSLRGSVDDHSGVTVTCTADLREFDAGLSGVVDRELKLPPGRRDYKYSYTTKRGVVAERLRADLLYAREIGGDSALGGVAAGGAGGEAGGEGAAGGGGGKGSGGGGGGGGGLSIFAAHLHARDHARRLWFGHFRGGKKVGDFGLLSRSGGYGPAQDWFLLLDDRGLPRHDRDAMAASTGAGAGGVPADADAEAARFMPGNALAPRLQGGDQLQANCVFDTLHATPWTPYAPTYPIGYGPRLGEEACSFLFMYVITRLFVICRVGSCGPSAAPAHQLCVHSTAQQPMPLASPASLVPRPSPPPSPPSTPLCHPHGAQVLSPSGAAGGRARHADGGGGGGGRSSRPGGRRRGKGHCRRDDNGRGGGGRGGARGGRRGGCTGSPAPAAAGAVEHVDGHWGELGRAGLRQEHAVDGGGMAGGRRPPLPAQRECQRCWGGRGQGQGQGQGRS